MPDNIKMRIYLDIPNTKPIGYDYAIPQLEYYDCAPSKEMFDPMDYILEQQKSERRERFVGMVSSNIAHALTEFLFKRKEL